VQCFQMFRSRYFERIVFIKKSYYIIEDTGRAVYGGVKNKGQCIWQYPSNETYVLPKSFYLFHSLVVLKAFFLNAIIFLIYSLE